MLRSVSTSEIERRWYSSASFSVFSCSLKRSCIYTRSPSPVPRVWSRCTAASRAADCPPPRKTRSMRTATRSVYHSFPRSAPTATRTCSSPAPSSSDWPADRSRTASTLYTPFHPSHLAILDVQPLELGETARVLEHMLVLEHHAQIHLLQNVFHAFLLYSLPIRGNSTQFGVCVFVLAVKRANHAGFADRAAHRANFVAPFEEGAAAEALDEGNQKGKR